MGNTQTFGQWLRLRRKALDITQDDLADCVGCSPVTIRMVENGQRRPSRQVAELLAGCLHVPEEERAEYIALARQVLPSRQGRAEGENEGAEAATQVVPGNLPAQLTALIGRNEDVENLTKLLLRKDVRLVTLTGQPGVGKTSLAIEAATDLQGYSQFRDGVFWIALAAVSDPDLVIPSIARVLDVQDVGGEPLADTLKRHLRQSRALLLLDNFEQVVEAGTAIADLLESCANLKALVTSREALNVHGEREFKVRALPLPDITARGDMSLETLAQNPAVALFVERAQSVDRDFVLTEENTSYVAAICERLDGLPLAIELVAARTRMLPLAALLQRLEDDGESRLNLLSGGARNAIGRHKTLRDAIGWSYDLLKGEEQVLFRRLGVFLGGFTLAAADAVCNAGSGFQPDLFEQVSQLVHKNLLNRELAPGGKSEMSDEPRFSMAEMIREYSLERMEESGEQGEVRLLHAEYFLAMVSSFDPLMVGENERLLGVRLDQDYDNVRAALAWAIENRPVDMGLPFGLSLARYWELRGYYSEGRDWLERIMSAQGVSDETDPSVRTKRAGLLLNAGRLSLYMSDYSAARAFLEESLGIASELGARGITASAQGHLGHIAWLQGDYAVALPLYEIGLRLREQEGNKTAIANSSWSLGRISAELGDFERAEHLLNKSLAMGRELDDAYVTFGSLRDLGATLCFKGEYGRAIVYLEETILLAQNARFRVGVSWAISALGFAKLAQGDYERAEELFRESLSMARTLDKHRIPDGLEGLAEIELARAKGGTSREGLRRAARLLGAAESVRRILQTKIIPVRVPVQERLVASLCARLGPEEYEQAYKAGEMMSLEEARSSG